MKLFLKRKGVREVAGMREIVQNYINFLVDGHHNFDLSSINPTFWGQALFDSNK